MADLTVAERVAAGVQWLDGHISGWPHDIRLVDLDMRSDCECIVGQLLGDYGLLADDDGEDMTPEGAAALGFDALTRVSGPERLSSGDPECDAEFAKLHAEWTRVITARREAESRD